MLALFSALSAPSNFYIMRHGQSEGNARGLMQGILDFPLTEKGRTQAAAAAKYFRTKDLDAVVCSPLSRAFETACIVAETVGLEVPKSDKLLIELDTGGFSGLSGEDAAKVRPEEYREFMTKSWAAVSDAESPEALFLRAENAWKVLVSIAETGKRNLLAVSHGGFMHWLVKTTTGTRNWLPLLPMGNCGVYHLYVEPVPGSGAALVSWRLLNHPAGL